MEEYKCGDIVSQTHLEELLELENLAILDRIREHGPQSIELLAKYSPTEELSTTIKNLELQGLVKKQGGYYGITELGLKYLYARDISERNASVFALLEAGEVNNMVEFKLIALTSYILGKGFYEYGNWVKDTEWIANPELFLSIRRLEFYGYVEWTPHRGRLYTVENFGVKLTEKGKMKAKKLLEKEWAKRLQSSLLKIKNLFSNNQLINKVTLHALYHLWRGYNEVEVRKIVEREVKSTSWFFDVNQKHIDEGIKISIDILTSDLNL